MFFSLPRVKSGLLHYMQLISFQLFLNPICRALLVYALSLSFGISLACQMLLWRHSNVLEWEV